MINKQPDTPIQLERKFAFPSSRWDAPALTAAGARAARDSAAPGGCSVGQSKIIFGPISLIEHSPWRSSSNRPLVDKAEARIEVGRWIEERYNRRRRHSAIGMKPPVQFEQHHQTAALAA